MPLHAGWVSSGLEAHMASEEHVNLLRKDVDAWNAWRRENPYICPDLSSADLSRLILTGADLTGANLGNANLYKANLYKATLNKADLRGADLSGAYLQGVGFSEANLTGVNLTGANLSGLFLDDATLIRANLTGADLGGAYLAEADLSGANLSGADLSGADLIMSNLRGADLSVADLRGADLSRADLSEANLRGANLMFVVLVGADLTNADLTNCRIYGISVWGLKLSKDTKQQNLIITHPREPEITVDNIEVAQFIYLLLHNEKIRDVIDTITSRVVLILGRFTDERKKVLDALREELRQRDYVPILFDFNKPVGRDVTETVSTLAHMARFVLADLTDAKSIPQELGVIVPHLPSVPVQPLLLNGSDEYGMFEHFRRYPWVLPIHRYETLDQLIADLGERVIRPAEIKVVELRGS